MPRSAHLTPSSQKYLILAFDETAVHLYLLRMNTGLTREVEHKFRQLAKAQGWEPFEKIEVLSLAVQDELVSLRQLARHADTR